MHLPFIEDTRACLMFTRLKQALHFIIVLISIQEDGTVEIPRSEHTYFTNKLSHCKYNGVKLSKGQE